MHCAGVIHGGKSFPPSFPRVSIANKQFHLDLTTSNILFHLSPHILEWLDAEVYTHLGDPEMESVRTHDGQLPGPHAPAMLIAPIQNSKMSNTSLLQESTIVSDFGQSYVIASPLPSYKPGMMLSYQSPEACFVGCVGFKADV